MSYPYQLYFADTECTGLSATENSVIELSVYRLNDDKQKTWCLRPSPGTRIEKEALRINGHKLEDILWKTDYGRATYKAPKDILPEVENFLMEDGETPENRILIAQNVQFDLGFMQELWRRENASDTFPWGARPRVIDTIQLQLFLDLAKNEKTTYLNLGGLVERYKIKKLKAHRADTDTLQLKDVFLAQLKTCQGLQKQGSNNE